MMLWDLMPTTMDMVSAGGGPNTSYTLQPNPILFQKKHKTGTANLTISMGLSFTTNPQSESTRVRVGEGNCRHLCIMPKAPSHRRVICQMFGFVATLGPGCTPPESQSPAVDTGLVVPLEMDYLAA